MLTFLSTMMFLSLTTYLPNETEPAELTRGGARIVCGEPEHDFGIVWAGDKLCHSFIIQNTGDETAYVHYFTGASTSMGPLILGPNSEQALTLCVNSRKLNGPFEKIITLVLNPAR